MTWVLIRGGLGNQMFEAAHALAVGQRFGVDPRFIDLARHARVARPWALSLFGIDRTELSHAKRALLLADFRLRFALHRRLGWQMGIMSDQRAWIGARPPRYIAGYFQGMRHMAPALALAKKAFRFPELPPHRGVPHGSRPTVAIHVRRGDYLNDPVARDFHLVCDPPWYRRAIEEMRERVGEMALVLFSDDVEGAKADLGLTRAEVIDNGARPGDADWMDLAQMAQCDHHILSNSSFSWWAAMLERSSESVIIAPAHWYPGKPSRELGIPADDWILL